MKVTVKIEDRFFEVEVGSLHTCPVVAMVEGERFEVWPDSTTVPPATVPILASSPVSPAVSRPAPGAPPAARSDAKAVHAPIPGVIISIAVRPGDRVEMGQELCILEAMKMKNSIRSPRAGEIATVNVAAGDHVKHHDLLFEYAN
jgi:biotin carboxyl carrier protein